LLYHTSVKSLVFEASLTDLDMFRHDEFGIL
jgi:hypothetical protein